MEVTGTASVGCGKKIPVGRSRSRRNVFDRVAALSLCLTFAGHIGQIVSYVSPLPTGIAISPALVSYGMSDPATEKGRRLVSGGAETEQCPAGVGVLRYGAMHLPKGLQNPGAASIGFSNEILGTQKRYLRKCLSRPPPFSVG